MAVANGVAGGNNQGAISGVLPGIIRGVEGPRLRAKLAIEGEGRRLQGGTREVKHKGPFGNSSAGKSHSFKLPLRRGIRFGEGSALRDEGT